MIYILLGFIVGGFLLGSIMFSRIVPRLVMSRDICSLSSDHNPGAANVFMKCGVKMGIICLILDILKGFVPVFIATFFLDTSDLTFSLVIAAPVLGHAVGVFNRFHGGKCISTSYGVLLGILPLSFIGFLLAELYIIFSLALKSKSNSLKSIVSYSLFIVGELFIMHSVGKYAVALGCLLISLIAIFKHVWALIPYVEKHKETEEAHCGG